MRPRHPGRTVEIRLDQPKQEQMDKLVERGRATWLGYGGSKGGSKSYTCRNILLRRRFSYPGTVGTIVRRIYRDVKDNHIDPFFLQYPFMRPWYNVADNEIRLPNSSILKFRYYETRADVENQGGNASMDALIDEAHQFSEEELNMLKGNVRWSKLGSTTAKMLLTFNPGGIGGSFLKRVFYDKKYQGNEKPDDFEFLQAFGWDNIYWAEDALKEDGISKKTYYFDWTDEQRFKYFITRTPYGRDLNSKPHALRIQWLLGDMSAFVGQYFDIWSEEEHVKTIRCDEWASRFIGIDWGFGHDAACYWGAEQAGGSFAVYREFAGAGRSPSALAQEIVSRTPQLERRHIKRIGLSHDAFARKDERDTIAQQMSAIFTANGMPYPQPSGRDKIGGAALIYDMLKEHRLVIDRSCTKLISTMPLISRDPEDRENTIKFDGDDSFDALKHLLHHRIGRGVRPHEEKVREQAKSIEDPYARWFWTTKQLQTKTNSGIKPDYNRPVWMGR